MGNTPLALVRRCRPSPRRRDCPSHAGGEAGSSCVPPADRGSVPCRPFRVSWFFPTTCMYVPSLHGSVRPDERCVGSCLPLPFVLETNREDPEGKGGGGERLSPRPAPRATLATEPPPLLADCRECDSASTLDSCLCSAVLPPPLSLVTPTESAVFFVVVALKLSQPKYMHSPI